MAVRSMFEKVWDDHVVGDGLLFIDLHLVHEVTSPQAFDGLRLAGRRVRRPDRTLATADHNVPTGRDQPDQLSQAQLDALGRNCEEFGVPLYGLGHRRQGIVHVIGPELGVTQPGMTIVCGDSHTSTHGAFGALAFGIGTSEVEHVLATQTLPQSRPQTMLISYRGSLGVGCTAKDLILGTIAQIGTDGATGHVVEFAGSAIRSLSMEARMTICNMSIEMGARGGMIAPDETTFNYIKGRTFAPQGTEWDRKLAEWKKLYSDGDAQFDKEIFINAADIEPMITYGTNPGMGVSVTGHVPELSEIDEKEKASFEKSITYMGLQPGVNMKGRKVDYVFIGSCTNSRIEDLRMVAGFVKGKKKASDVQVWIVPGSKQVEKQAIEEGIDKIFEEAGFKLRQPGCSACLGMNEDKIPAGKYCISTSNRNFEGRQGPSARTLLASPLTAAAAAITGVVSDVREFMEN